MSPVTLGNTECLCEYAHTRVLYRCHFITEIKHIFSLWRICHNRAMMIRQKPLNVAGILQTRPLGEHVKVQSFLSVCTLGGQKVGVSDGVRLLIKAT